MLGGFNYYKKLGYNLLTKCCRWVNEHSKKFKEKGEVATDYG